MKYLIDSLLAISTVVMFAAAFPQEDPHGSSSQLCNNGQLEEEFDRENRDSSWADSAESVLFSHLAQAAGLELRDMAVECHQTVCRLHFVFTTDEYQRNSGNTLVADALDAAPGFVKSFGRISLGTDGQPSIVYYLKRDGACRARAAV